MNQTTGLLRILRMNLLGIGQARSGDKIVVVQKAVKKGGNSLLRTFWSLLTTHSSTPKAIKSTKARLRLVLPLFLKEPQMLDDSEPLEIAVLQMLLTGDHPVLAVLRR